MSSSNIWADFEVFKNSIRLNTVAKLQTIITGWSDQCRVNIAKSGKKQDLIDRMTRVMNDWKESNQVDKWLRAKAVLEQVKETGHHYAMPPDVTGGPYPQPFASSSSHKLNGTPAYLAPTGAGSSHIRYNPYAPARKIESSAPSQTVTHVKPSIRFKSSPFYRIDQAVSAVVECPESTSAMDRRSQTLAFTLTSEQISKLQAPNFQLRLFCTSSSWHTHHNTGFRTEQPCPIEFPATCEVRVNNTQLTANLKGLKKKPGTAPPPDLGSSVRENTQIQNHVNMVYVNNQQPVLHKKFYMIVNLVEVTSVDQLVEKLRKGKYKSEGDIRAKMIQTARFDEDIEAGPQKMSLKCPLSYLRVDTPCRSIHCPHAQCFDATSWFAMMEQTTTWLCPVCDKVLVVEDLIIDGYFDHILKDAPDAEDVMVEADGEWHTSDNKYASAGWRASHPLTTGVVSVVPVSPQKERTPKLTSSRTRQEVILLSDSEDEEEGVVKRELSPTSSYAPSSQPLPPFPKPASANEVIDLTLDSDDDELPPPPKPTHKRKEMELNPS
ncbi:PINIT domain-containing protein, partial [Hysterangium stoloniferum]